MKIKLILEKAVTQFKNDLPFVLFKKPNETVVNGYFQKTDDLFLVDDFSERGFVFASFDGKQTILIPASGSEIVKAQIEEISLQSLNNDIVILDISAQIDFENLVSNGIEAINENQFQKVVLSRKEIVALKNFDLNSAFQNLIHLYATAFCYCFFHPKIGLWFGASPEQLLNCEGNSFKTIALAGTKKNTDSEEVIWKNKEIKEQQFVTDYIVNKLKDVSQNLEVSKPYNFKAGLLWHIKTDISGEFNLGFGLQKIIKLLHPTAAVCGFPKEASKAFILEKENYERTFYTGFLGVFNEENQNEIENSDLYVNLRCMKIEFNDIQNNNEAKAILFMGCGITKDSNPEKEWMESVNKSITMKRVLAP